MGDSLDAEYSADLGFSTRPVFDWSKNDFNFNVPVKLNGKNIIDVIYPVGSIYMSVKQNSPASLFGGSWEQIEGRFLLGVGTPAANNSNWFGELNMAKDDPYGWVEARGGQFHHVLTTSEIPPHNHSLHFSKNVGPYANPPLGDGGTEWGGKSNTISNTGGGQAHNNMPPFYTVYMWKRVS